MPASIIIPCCFYTFLSITRLTEIAGDRGGNVRIESGSSTTGDGGAALLSGGSSETGEGGTATMTGGSSTVRDGGAAFL